jgi:uncharacterized protein (TIGR02301 family)
MKFWLLGPHLQNTEVNPETSLFLLDLAGMPPPHLDKGMSGRRLTKLTYLAGFVAALMVTTPLPVYAAAGDPPFQEKIERLAEILGSVHYLRNLCGENTKVWREKMDALLTAENPAPERRARMVASFNRGYKAFAQTYEKCTPAATTALSRYTVEGASLTNEIVLRYGN